MKKTRHRGLALSLFCCSLILIWQVPSSSAVRATSLIFSKTTTTTTVAPEEVPTASDGDVQAETPEDAPAANATKYTGIPQIDYVLDPNLPRELNGYNLSEYPFYEAVPPPETMDFKCDGLHDGFYASVPHKCQVYHHCLYGTRFDFLCANYTAFDQKTFICQFVSEVDCKNSPNYFSRNDALYQATTSPPPPTTTTTTTTTTPPPRPTRRPGRRRPVYDDYYDDDDYYERDYDYRGPKRRPRPRPGPRWKQADDMDYRYDRERNQEDSYAEERPYRRPAKRPTYKQPEYEEDRRPGGRNGQRRPRPKRPVEEEEDRYVEDEDRRSGPRNEYRPREERRRPKDDVMNKRPRDELRPRDENRDRDEVKPRDEIRPRDEVRNRGEGRVKDEIRPKDEIRSRDEIRPRDETRSRDEIRSRDEVRPRDEIRQSDDKARDEVRSRDVVRPRDEKRNRDEVRPRDDPIRPRDDPIRPRDDPIRPRDDPIRPRDDPIRPRDEPIRPRDELFRPREDHRLSRDDSDVKPFRTRDDRYSEGRRYREQEKRNTARNPPKADRDYEDEREEEKSPKVQEVQPLVKPNGKGIFSQPRIPPKIKRPVPVNEKHKFDYVPVVTPKAPPKKDDDYYYDYEEDEPSRPASSGKSSSISLRPKPEPIVKEKFKPSRPHYSSPTPKPKPLKQPIDDEDYYSDPKPQKFISYQRDEKVKKPTEDDYYDDYEDTKKSERSHPKPVEEEIKEVKKNVKIIKRPFLPSRGGSPYLPRGLKPVAGKNLSFPPNTTPKPTTTTSTSTTTTPSTTTFKYITTTKPVTTTELPTTTEVETTPQPTTSTTTSAPTTTETYRTTSAYKPKTSLTTTESFTTTFTTEKPTTTVETEKENPSTTHSNSKNHDEEYEYYDEDDIDYDTKNKKVSTPAYEEPVEKKPVLKPQEESESESEIVNLSKEEDYYEDEKDHTTEKPKHKAILPEIEQDFPGTPKHHRVITTTEQPELKTNRPTTTTDQITTTYKVIKYLEPHIENEPRVENHANKLASKVLKAYTDNYENVREKLKSTYTPNIYLNDYIGPILKSKFVEPLYPKVEIQPEISKPYTATGKPLKLPESIAIKHNLADSFENEYDVRLNEAVAPTIRVPSGFVVPNDREYTFSRLRNFQPEQQFAASELSAYQLRKHPQISGVSIRTPTSYYLQPQRMQRQEDYQRPSRHLVYRGVMV